MSETNQPPQRVPPDDPSPSTPEAKVKKNWWLGWIWLLPILAVAIVAWLGFGAWTSSGPTVHVIFTSAAGIEAGNTSVKYQGQNVGKVESVQLQKDLKHTDVVINLDSQLSGHLGPGTRFWIEGGQVSLNNLGELKTVIAGPYIGIAPQNGKPTRHFVGLTSKPILPPNPNGRRYHLHEATLGTVSAGSPVLHLGVNVGQVVSAQIAPDGQGVDIEAYVRAPYDKLVHQGTRFWDASAVQVTTGNGGPSLRLASLPALVSGAVGFVTPKAASNTPVAGVEADFQLYKSETEAKDAPSSDALAYQVVFNYPSDTLPDNAPVMLAGKRIGAVGHSDLLYNGASGQLKLRAKLMLEPALVSMTNSSGSTRAQMNAMLSLLISQGLRASLKTSPPFVGSEQVVLHFVSNPPQASLGTGSAPEIPTESSGSGIDALLSKASDTMNNLNSVPFAQIGNNLKQLTDRLAALSSSPQLTDAVHRMDDAVTNLDKLSTSMNHELPQALDRLDHAAKSVDALVSTNEEVASQPRTSTLPSTLFELRRAARSVRELADAIRRNPQSLLTGR